MNKRNAYLEAMGIDIWSLRSSEAMVEHAAESTDSEQIETYDWHQLAHRVSGCENCVLSTTRTQAVLGVGSLQADLLLVGEAPGAQEDRQGEPFVGRAGQLLNAMLQAIGLSRETVYIANVIKCRPPNNRNPSPEEVACCSPFLQRQIELLQPKLIVALGRVAAHHLLTTAGSLASLRKQIWRYRDIPLLVTYHPAYLLRSLQEKRRSYDDLLQIKQFLLSA